jgi:signal transduction histidine kinase
MPASLGGRLLLIAAGLILVAFGVTGVVMDLALHHFIQGQVDGRLDGQILTVTDALRAGPDGRLRLERSVDGPPFERPLSGWYWQAWRSGSPRAGSLMLRSGSLQGEDFLVPGTLPEDRPKPATIDGTGPGGEPLRVRLKRVRVGSEMALIAAAAPAKALTGPLRDALTPLILTLALLAVFLIGGVLLQVRVGLRPLTRLRAQLSAVRTGRADRITGPQPSEILPLVAELNTLLDQNAANLERARRHVANLAHGLKTPLATLALVLEEPGRDPEGRAMPLLTTMDRRIRHHLARARTAALVGADRSRALLAPRIADHVAAFVKLYADKGLDFRIDVGPEAAVACEGHDLDEMLGNLLDNACKWARTTVLVRSRAIGTKVDIAIEDDGPGLSGEQAADMVKPGRRLDEAAPGYGFGLPITRELVELYGGSLTLARSDLGGLRATATLPSS